MGRKRHTPEQIITALREAEVGLARGKSVKLMSRELGITEQTYYRWRREYGGMKVSQARRLKELEREKRAPEASSGGLDTGQAESWRKRPRETSEPRAPTTLCGACTSAARGVGEESVPVLGQPRTTQRRARKVASDEGALRGDIVRLASRFGRYGYRRVTDMLRIEGWGVKHKRVERIWRQEG